jgi:hypothetical protein
MDDVLGVPMRVGPLSQSEPAPPEVGAAPVADGRADVQEPSVAPLAETSGRPGAKRAGLWGAVTSVGTVL